MSHETKTAAKETQNLGPVATELHRKLKSLASSEGKTLRAFLEEHLGPLVEWAPENKAQLKLADIA